MSVPPTSPLPRRSFQWRARDVKLASRQAIRRIRRTHSGNIAAVVGPRHVPRPASDGDAGSDRHAHSAPACTPAQGTRTADIWPSRSDRANAPWRRPYTSQRAHPEPLCVRAPHRVLHAARRECAKGASAARGRQRRCRDACTPVQRRLPRTRRAIISSAAARRPRRGSSPSEVDLRVATVTQS
jgi:hypothetical protein